MHHFLSDLLFLLLCVAVLTSLFSFFLPFSPLFCVMCGICCVLTLRRRRRCLQRTNLQSESSSDLAWLAPERITASAPAELIAQTVEGVGRLVANRGPDCTCTARMMHDSEDRFVHVDKTSRPSEGTSVYVGEELSNLSGAGHCSMVCQGSVLSLRGVAANAGLSAEVPVKQPVLCTDSDASSDAAAPSWLLWNGEVFGGTLNVALTDCDTLVVMRELHQLEHRICQLPADHDRHALLSAQIAKFFENQVEGPYAFIYFASSLNFLVFGRDPTGRRSLVACHVVMSRPAGEGDSLNEAEQNGEGADTEFQLIVVSSVGKRLMDATHSNLAEKCDKRASWKEVPVSGVYGIHLAPMEAKQDTKSADSFRLLSAPWSSAFHGVHPLLRAQVRTQPERNGTATCSGMRTQHEGMIRFRSVCSEVKYDLDASIDSSKRAAECYGSALLDAVYRRVLAAHCGGDPTRPVAVLFSGGIDSTVLAAMAHYCLPLETPIELINVAFRSNPEQTPDRIAAFRSARELVGLPFLAKPNASTKAEQTREWRLVLVDVSSEELAESQAHLRDIINPSTTVMDHDIGAAVWFASRGIGRMQKLHQQERRASMSGAPGEWAAGKADDDRGCSLISQATPEQAKDFSPVQFSKHFRVAHGDARVASACPSLKFGALAHGDDTVSDVPVSSASQTHTMQTTGPVEHSLSAKRPRQDGESLSLKSNGFPSTNSADDKSLIFAPLVEALIAEGYDDIPQEESEHTSVVAGTCDGMQQRKIVLPKGRVLLSTLGKEYGALLTPIWTASGYKKLGQYLNDAERAGYLRFGFVPQPPQRKENKEESGRATGSTQEAKRWSQKQSQGSTVKYVVLARQEDIERAKALKYSTIFTYSEGSDTDASSAPPPTVEGYRCASKVVLLGMGADETLGGYVRYERSFSREGAQAVMSEMSRDYARLWQRNLGRDDRCVADCGREGRFPFLDENVIRSLEAVMADAQDGEGKTGTWQTAIADVCSFIEGPGIGDKKLLRTVARMIGLQDVSRLQKRAIQFGSRIANSKTRGSAALNDVDAGE